jgi:ethanolamine utilization protein EutQ (cupin superfamily)
MVKEMQKVIKTEIVSLDRDSKEYKAVMSEYLRIEVKELGEEEANEKFEGVNSEYVYGTKSIYKFNDGLERNVIQLNFLSPTFIPETLEYSNHIQNWSLFACEEDGETHLIQSMELHTFCMHEGGH